MTGYFLDFKEFNRNLKRLTDVEFPEYIEKGLFNAMNELLNDSITKPPQAPFKEGHLWASRTGASQEHPFKVEKTASAMSLKGGFHIAYAHRHHEVPPGTYKYTKDPKGKKGAIQPGPKFMQSKMSQHGKKYIGIIADTIKGKGK